MASPPPAGRRKSAMRSPVTWVIVLGVALAGGAYLLYRRSQAAASSGATGTSAGTGTDWSGEIATLQTEIEDLQSSAAQQKDTDTDKDKTGGGSSGGGSGGGGGWTPGPPSREPPPLNQRPAMPALVRVASTTPTTAEITWSPVRGAASYRVRLTYRGKLARQETTTRPRVTVTGLTPNHTYTVHVAAVNADGTSPETNGPAAKTKRQGLAGRAAAVSARKAA